MANNIIIPFNSTKPYLTSYTTVDKNTYKLTFRFNGTAGKWILDIIGITNDVKVYGIALVTAMNLLKPYAIKEMGALYILDTQGSTDPTRYSLGNRHKIQYVVKANESEII